MLSISYSQSISYLSPSSGQEGINDLQVYLYASGVNFYDVYSYPGIPYDVSFSEGGISTSSLNYVNSSIVKFNVDISQNISISSRDVTLQTRYKSCPGCSWNYYSFVKENAFTVTENNDGITYISPSEVQAGGQYQINIYASGVNFTDPYSSTLYQGLSFSGNGIDNYSTQVYSDWIQTTIQIDMLTYTNERDLTVYTDNYTYTLEDALTITDPDPIEIVSISPNSGYQGTDNLMLDIDLDQSLYTDAYSNASLIFSGSGVTSQSITGNFSGDNSYQAYIDISNWADIGTHDVTLSFSWQETISATLENGFTVNESDWELISITPNESFINVSNLQVTLIGNNTNWGCCGDPQLSFEGSGIYVDWVTVNSSEQLTAQIDISSSASYEYRDVTIINGGQVVILENGFKLNHQTTLFPDVGYPGDAFEVNLISGDATFNGMYGNPSVYFSGSGLNVSNVNLTSDNTMIFSLSIGDAEPGMRDIYINQYSWLPDYSFPDVFEVLLDLSTIYADPQQVIMADQNEIPIKLNALETDQIESVIFAVEVSPTGGSASIEADLDIEISDPDVTVIITQGGDGVASVVISGFDPAISGQDLVIGNLIVDIPQEGVNQGDNYHLSISSVSGSTPYYESVSMYGIEDVELQVITSPPEFAGLSDVSMIEGTSETVSFTVVDLDGTFLELSYDAPDYVTCSLSWLPNQTEYSGSCSINSYMGAESGTVSLTVTNSEAPPEMGNGSFSININHYPVLNITETIYAPVNESTSIDIELSDFDGDDLTLTLLSLPEYTEFNFSSPTSGTLDISPVDEDSDGGIVFHATDDGNPGISIDITLQIIVNHAPQFDQFEDPYHVVENDVLTFIISFSDQNGDPISYNVDYMPPFGTYSEIENGLQFTFTPSSSDGGSPLWIVISDPWGMTTQQGAMIFVYNTYLAGDVRPNGGENAGDFGDDLIIAPDVVNALRVATSSPDTEAPDSLSSLYDAFDVSPIDIDVNQDGDFYDEGEHGGNGYIEAADVIVSLKRATMMPGYPNIRRADVNYPSSTHIEDTSRSVTNRDNATDALLFGNIEGHPGQTVQVPVYLRRGESESNLNGLISGFSIIGSDEEVPGLESEITFNIEVECSSMDIPSGNEFLSLLMMDLDDLAPNTETLLGTLDFTIPINANTEDIYYIYSQGSSGSSSDYTPVIFSEGTNGSVTVEEPLVMISTGLMHSGANLKSFYVHPEDASVATLFSPIMGQLDAIFGEGTSTIYIDGEWIGTLIEIDVKSGYWLKMLIPANFSFNGYAVDPGTVYDLHSGANLISFPSPGSVGVSDGIPDEIEDQFLAIFGEGVSTINMDGIWVGSLLTFEGSKGYWAITETALSFSFDLTNLSEDVASRVSTDRAPAGYEYNQSTEQAFYFIENIVGSNPGDWILAYSGDLVVGARQWQGSIIDVPAMGGDDGSDFTRGYMEAGVTPKFKLLQGGKLIDLTGDVPVWSQNQVFIVSSLMPLPESFSLSAAYPNPFNPTTTLSFALPIESDVTLSIYNLQGREVVSLINGNMEAGYHLAVWNADAYSSGVYFVQMIAGDYIHTQKIMLVK